MIVCTVSPTIQDGTVVRWYRSEIAAEMRQVMVSASRNGVQLGDHLMDGDVPSDVLADARKAHRLLGTHVDGNCDLVNAMATHRREKVLGGSLVPVVPPEPAAP